MTDEEKQLDLDCKGYHFFLDNQPGVAKMMSDKLVELEKRYGRMFVVSHWDRDSNCIHLYFEDSV